MLSPQEQRQARQSHWTRFIIADSTLSPIQFKLLKDNLAAGLSEFFATENDKRYFLENLFITIAQKLEQDQRLYENLGINLFTPVRYLLWVATYYIGVSLQTSTFWALPLVWGCLFFACGLCDALLEYAGQAKAHHEATTLLETWHITVMQFANALSYTTCTLFYNFTVPKMIRYQQVTDSLYFQGRQNITTAEVKEALSLGNYNTMVLTIFQLLLFLLCQIVPIALNFSMRYDALQEAQAHIIDDEINHAFAFRGSVAAAILCYLQCQVLYQTTNINLLAFSPFVFFVALTILHLPIIPWRNLPKKLLNLLPVSHQQHRVLLNNIELITECRPIKQAAREAGIRETEKLRLFQHLAEKARNPAEDPRAFINPSLRHLKCLTQQS